MGSTVSVTGGELVYGGNDGPNEVRMTEAGGVITVSDIVPLTPSAGCGPVSPRSEVSGVLRRNLGLGQCRKRRRRRRPWQRLSPIEHLWARGRRRADRRRGPGPHRGRPRRGLDSGDQINLRGPGPDSVVCDGQDTVSSDPDDSVPASCTNNVAPSTTIGSGPDGPTNDTTPSFSFIADEAVHHYECVLEGPVPKQASDCPPPYEPSGPSRRATTPSACARTTELTSNLTWDRGRGPRVPSPSI